MKTNPQDEKPGIAVIISKNTPKTVGTPAKGGVFPILLGICFCLWAVSSAARAGTTITPNLGTVGTEFTIAGSQFGPKQGTVFIGGMPCQVLAWSDTTIECLIKIPMEPGEYDVVLNPQGKPSRMTLPNAFAIMPPKLAFPERRPYFVSPGDKVTVHGAFFGDGAGSERVTIEDFQGEKKSCPIVGWEMDSITFILPSGIQGLFHLRISNAVGTDIQPGWGTFAPPPYNPPNLLGSEHGGPETRNTAAAVKFRDKLWFFWSDKDNDGNHVQYQTWDGASSWSGETDVAVNGAVQKSKGVVTPVAVDDVLYVFYADLTG